MTSSILPARDFCGLVAGRERILTSHGLGALLRPDRRKRIGRPIAGSLFADRSSDRNGQRGEQRRHWPASDRGRGRADDGGSRTGLKTVVEALVELAFYHRSKYGGRVFP